MRSYVTLMDIKAGASVLDLGGQPMIWDSVTPSLNLTNLKFARRRSLQSHIASQDPLCRRRRVRRRRVQRAILRLRIQQQCHRACRPG